MKKFLLLAVIIFLISGYMNCGAPRFGEDTQFIVFPPKVIHFKFNHFCPVQGFTLKQVFLNNISAVMGAQGQYLVDSDRDGLSDVFESDSANQEKYAIGPDSTDTRKDGYTDFFVTKMGYDLQKQLSLPNCETPEADNDLDSLSNCEERLLSTDPTIADSDFDGIPDGLEFRFGLNPLMDNDVYLDPDVDRLTNLDEIRQNTPIFFSNSLINSPYTAIYTHSTQIPSDGSCFDYMVTNVPIVRAAGGNHIQILFLEFKEQEQKVHRFFISFHSEVKNDLTINIDYDPTRTEAYTFEDLPLDPLIEEAP